MLFHDRINVQFVAGRLNVGEVGGWGEKLLKQFETGDSDFRRLRSRQHSESEVFQFDASLDVESSIDGKLSDKVCEKLN